LLFILLGARRLTQRVHRAFPRERAARLLAITDRVSPGMEQFMGVKTIGSAAVGARSAVILSLFGLDQRPLWGGLFLASNYITYIGSMAACVPPIVLAYLGLDSAVQATALAALIVVNRFVWIDYIEIRMSGKHLNIDSVLLFLWLAYW